MRSLLDYADEQRVVGTQARELKRMQAENALVSHRLSHDIARAEALAVRLQTSSQVRPAYTPPTPASSATRSFPDIFLEAAPDATLQDALDPDEIAAALDRLHEVDRRPDHETKLDRTDIVFATAVGVLAAVADLTMVAFPASSGISGGVLDEGLRRLLDTLLPAATIRRLERAYKVPYDAATNRNLIKPIAGLLPKSHRFHSLGHDPLLGWIFGVRDVLSGSFTAISKDGQVVVQKTTAQLTELDGLIGLLEAFRRVGGHMISDVNTSMGLPAPLMPLLMFVRIGRFGQKDRTIADIARFMYLKGYDLRYFMTRGVTTAIVETLIRGVWIGRRLAECHAVRTALPNATHPRLRHQLLIAHATAAAANAGRVAISQNPFALNWAQWLALARYINSEALHHLYEPARRAEAEDALLDADLKALLAHGRAN